MATKYIAKLDGVIVGKRKTENRTYSHCVVAQSDEVKAATAAYDYTASSQDRETFAWYEEIVRQGLAHKYVAPTTYRTEPDLEFLADAQRHVDMGFDGYIAHLRQIEIDRFESARKKGAYQPRAHSWAGRLDLAQKEAGRISKWKKQVWIVEAEVA